MKESLVLAINPGSTSTKIAVFNCDYEKLFQENIKYTAEELAPFASITDQYEFREDGILTKLKEAGIDKNKIKIVVGRGGLVKPIESGMYEVNEAMIKDLKVGILGQHASNLGGLIADDIAKNIPGAKAFIADPVVVDELQDVARITGHPACEKVSIFHALNQKAIARAHAKSQNKDYNKMNLIVAHLGGGISVGAHYQGRVIDVNQALDGDGPFTPERSGGLPTGALIKLCFSGKYSYNDVKKMLTGQGGLVAYLGTNDAQKVENMVKDGDEKATLIYKAMAYQIAREIGSAAAVLKGKVEAILFTGGIAYDKTFIEWIKEYVEFIAPIFVYPGEDEMKALAFNGINFLKGESQIKEYK
ncbi:MAG: butyrate kinase [Bacteroidales bacterium]|jgi:butyrate kinase|nr:butyrate kinase [Bacteroidales bacterium]